MDDQTLLKLSKDMTLSYLEEINAVVTETHGLYSVEIPPKYEKIFNGIKKRITFDLEVADVHSCEYVVPGSSFFAIIINEIRKQAPVVAGSIKKRSNGPSEHLEKLGGITVEKKIFDQMLSSALNKKAIFNRLPQLSTWDEYLKFGCRI